MKKPSPYLQRLRETLLDSIDEEEKDLAQFARPESGDLSTLQLPAGIQNIIRLLVANPLLVIPTQRWVEQKIREINTAQLRLLYTDEELQEMANNLPQPDPS